MKDVAKNINLVLLGKRIRALREGLDISQEDLGRKSGLHRTYIGGVERGERNLSVWNICKISGALKVTPSDLMCDVHADPATWRQKR
jgi:transcriptional regulator with XRE-family HTH domain